ncbi:MAG TPA: EscU/YscU/HrcU family type III secretion system export apparatus switch protein [Candidatus Nitrosotenuis sp.]|jgi:flagellar biosynthesis protein|nr:EscU/YscU/HrcU family type III secretion system export apparatus switch protein [Candidatus Nitrosotenuis sp.]
MSRPEAEAVVFELEGMEQVFYTPGPPPGRAAVALGRGPDGRLRVLARGRGPAAERILEKARQAGVEVQTDPARVEELLRAEGEGSRVPPQIYELVAAVIAFAQELSDEKV